MFTFPKNQNFLRDIDIKKIVGTYRNRKEEKKYSRKATLEEIAKNEYNLNIPRYVETLEAETSIDINAIAEDLKTLEREISITEKTITEFCNDLKISTPF